TGPRLELPGALPWRDDERAAAQTGHARLERSQGSQRGIEEQQPQHLARQRLRLRPDLETPRKLEQRAELLPRKIPQVEKALHAGRSASVSRSMSTCSSSRMNGGSRRRML